MVLPDRIELTRQSRLILILLRFSVQRSVFVWHSCVTPWAWRLPHTVGWLQGRSSVHLSISLRWLELLKGRNCGICRQLKTAFKL